MDRPPADPVKLLSSWTDWESGELPPGRLMSDLKTGGFRDVIEHLATEPTEVPTGGADVTKLLGAWMEWETGDSVPTAVLTDLQAGGLGGLLATLAERAHAAAQESGELSS